MYILTEDNEIINLTQYQKVTIEPGQKKGNPPINTFILIAKGVREFDSTKSEIAYFETKEDAIKAVKDLFNSIRKEKMTWNVDNFKNPPQPVDIVGSINRRTD